jgi:hypothetical protein
MLGSITPLGERMRHSSWGVTYSWHFLGSILGGAAFGGVLGIAGAPLVHLLDSTSEAARPLILASVVLTGLMLDLRVAGAELPTIHRQVRQDWVGRYRGWAYGFGFGVQLGAGVVTVVVTATVYATFFGALLSGSAITGALIGAVFGGVRAAPLALAASARDPGALGALTRRFESWAAPARSLNHAAQGVVVVCAATLALVAQL